MKAKQKKPVKPELTKENMQSVPLSAMGGIFSEMFSDVFKQTSTPEQQSGCCEECDSVEQVQALMDCKKAFHRLSVMLEHLRDQLQPEVPDWTRAYCILAECQCLVSDGNDAVDTCIQL